MHLSYLFLLELFNFKLCGLRVTVCPWLEVFAQTSLNTWHVCWIVFHVKKQKDFGTLCLVSRLCVLIVVPLLQTPTAWNSLNTHCCTFSLWSHLQAVTVL